MAIFLSSLKRRGQLDHVHITVCNVGSRKHNIDDDYASKGWNVFAPNLSIYGFDADADACDAANADLEERQVNWAEKHIPLAIAKSTGETTLYVTQHPMCSSLYAPNEPYLARFADLPELVNLDFTVELETTTLDEFFEAEGIETIDFLQIDVQGAELQVLQGASKLLGSVLGIQTEVEFSHLYVDQPLFADIDQYLKARDFTLFHLAPAYISRARSPFPQTVTIGQLLWGEAFYFRDFLQESEALNSKSPKQLLKLACVADVLGFSDYTLEILEYLTLNYGKDTKYNFANAIVESLAQVAELAEVPISTLSIVSKLKEYITESFEVLQSSTFQSATRLNSPLEEFFSVSYQRHNNRRLEHLASLGLNLANKSVLEVGAGIGDHTSFFLDRGCQVLTTEGRDENLEILRSRYPDLQVRQLDLDYPDPNFAYTFDVVYCYGLLYHLKHPTEAISFMAERCKELLLLETCVSFGDEIVINLCSECADSPSQAISGQGCRPTRQWIFEQLKQHFEFVYLPVTQPNHDEFPLDWTVPPSSGFTRSVFIASRIDLKNPLLLQSIPIQQRRH